MVPAGILYSGVFIIFILLIVEKFFLQKLFERIPSFSRIYTIVAIIVGWVFLLYKPGKPV